MLNILFNEINNIISILGISENDSEINIEYFPNTQPSAEQMQQINTLISIWPLKKSKIEKLKQLDQVWANSIKNGWTASSGYKLGIDIQDITLLTGAFTLAKEANSAGFTDPTYIVDIEGNSHALSLSEFTQLMLQYGQARATLSNSYANLKKSINEATNLEELNAINLTI